MEVKMELKSELKKKLKRKLKRSNCKQAGNNHKASKQASTTLLPFCCVFNSRISGTQFGAGLPRSAHAQSDV